MHDYVSVVSERLEPINELKFTYEVKDFEENIVPSSGYNVPGQGDGVIKLIEDSNKHDPTDPRTPRRMEYFQQLCLHCRQLRASIFSTAAVFEIFHEIQAHNYPEL